MSQLILELSNHKDPSQTLKLRWNIHSTPPGLYWMKALKKVLDGPIDFFPRYSGFVDGFKDMQWLSDRLNECIDIINKDGRYKIDERADGTFSQEFSNIIHHHFEVLIGDIGRFAQYYKDSPPQVMEAVCGLNHLIHDMETLDRAQSLEKVNPEGAFSSIIVEFKESERFHLPKECYPYFKMDIEFGDLFLHYSQIGKTWWEVFRDNDVEIFPEAIQPLYSLTGEFDAYFGEYHPFESTEKEFHDFLKKHGQDPKDPELRLGTCPVASFIRDLDLSNRQYKKLIANYMSLRSISLVHNNSLIAFKGRPKKSSYDYVRLMDI